MNYKRGPLHDARDTALDTEADLSMAKEDLSLFPVIEHQMDSWQDKGYAQVQRIAENSTDLDARTAAGVALHFFAEAERLQAINDEHVAECEHEVCDASDHNHDVIGILEEEVVEARQVVA